MNGKHPDSDYPARRGRSWGILAFVVLSATVLVCGMFFVHDPNKEAVLPPCTLYQATGLLCAGCGGTRSLGHLVHGRIGPALRCNALFILAIPFLLLYGAEGLLGELLPIRLPSLRYDVRTATVLLVLLAAFTVLRNIPAYPFTLLAPSEPPPAWPLPDHRSLPGVLRDSNRS